MDPVLKAKIDRILAAKEPIDFLAEANKDEKTFKQPFESTDNDISLILEFALSLVKNSNAKSLIESFPNKAEHAEKLSDQLANDLARQLALDAGETQKLGDLIMKELMG